jgi:hypothetical protein
VKLFTFFSVVDSHHFGNLDPHPDPDPYQSDKLDPEPDPHQFADENHVGQRVSNKHYIYIYIYIYIG